MKEESSGGMCTWDNRVVRDELGERCSELGVLVLDVLWRKGDEVASGEAMVVWRVSSRSVVKRRDVVVGVGGSGVSVKGGRNVIVDEGDGEG